MKSPQKPWFEFSFSKPKCLLFLALFLSLGGLAHAQTYFGNQATVQSAGSYNLNGATLQSSIRFTMTANESVTQIRVYGQAVGSGETYTVSLQGDSAGLPNGVTLASGVLSPVSGWNLIPIPATALAGGTVYHIVIQSLSGVTAANYFQQWYTAPQNFLIPLNQTPDPQLTQLTYNGATWTNQNGNPIFLLDYNDGTYFGVPYDINFTGSAAGSFATAQVFSPSTTQTVSKIGVWAYTVGTPVDNLRYTLVDLSGPTTLDQGTWPLGTFSSTTSWQDTNLTAPVVLTAGHTYKLIFTSPGSTTPNYYDIPGGNSVNASPYLGATFEGTTGYGQTSTDGGSTWTTALNADFSFRFTFAPTPTPTNTPTNSPTATPTPTTNDTVNPPPTKNPTPTTTQNAPRTPTENPDPDQQPHPDNHRYGHRHADGYPDPFRHFDPNRLAHRQPDPDADQHPQQYRDEYTYLHIYEHPYGHHDGYRDPDTHQ